MWKIVLIVVAFQLLPKMIRKVQVWLSLRERRFQAPTVQAVELSEIPADHLPLFSFAREQIEDRLGFRFLGCSRVQFELPGSLDPFQELLVSEDGQTYAVIGYQMVPGTYPFSVIYVSLTENGERIETVDCIQHMLIDPVCEVADALCDDFVVQYRKHLQRMQNRETTGARWVNFSNTTLHNLVEHERADLELLFEANVETRTLESKNDYFRYGAGSAWAQTGRIIMGGQVSERVLESNRNEESEPTPYSAEADLAEYDRSIDVKNVVSQLRSLTTKVMILIVSACLLYTSPSPRDRTRSRMPSSA